MVFKMRRTYEQFCFALNFISDVQKTRQLRAGIIINKMNTQKKWKSLQANTVSFQFEVLFGQLKHKN